MGWHRRPFLIAGGGSLLAGCAGGGFSAPATPPTSAFEASIDPPDTVVLRYTGIGSQDTDRFRIVIEGAGAADGTYGLAAVTGDDRWTDQDRYRLNQSTLGLEEPLALDGLVLELQYDDDGAWRPLLRTEPAD